MGNVVVSIYSRNDGLQPQVRLQEAVNAYLLNRGLQPLREALGFSHTSDGKPVVSYPGLQVSISHSGALWGCALSEWEVGLDIQQIRGQGTKAIARRFFHPDEVAFLEQTGFSEFFTVWAAKESYVKYTGEGITESFSSFSVVGKNGLARRVGKGKISLIPFLPDYRICVCAELEEGLFIRDQRT